MRRIAIWAIFESRLIFIIGYCTSYVKIWKAKLLSIVEPKLLTLFRLLGSESDLGCRRKLLLTILTSPFVSLDTLEWSLMISGVTKVNLTCRRSQTDLLCEAAFCVEHQAPNIGLWGDNLISATAGCVKLRQLEQLVHIVKGRQPERRVLDRIGYDKLEAFITLTLLTSLQPMVRRLFFWVWGARDFSGG